MCGCGRELAVFKTAVSPVASPSTDVSRETPDAAGGTPVLTQSELDALVASARDRWTASGLTDEQLATLRTLKFEVADLPGWYLGEAGGERIRVDADAGGNGWFIDPTPGKDEEFGVPEGQQKLAGGEARNERNHRNQSENGMHPGRGAGISAAPAGAGSVSFGGPVVLARGLASPPANFRSPSGTGNAQLDNFGDPSETRNAHPAAATRRYTDPAGAPAGHIDLLTALLHEMGHALGLDDTYLEKDRDNLMYGFLTKGERRLPAKDQAVGATPHAEAHPHFLGTPLNIGDLPAGKTVTITYVVNISSATPNVSNQGTVSGSNFANVLTDDPTVAGTANPTVTPVELPPVVSNVAKGANEDVAVAFAASDFTPRQLQRSEWRRAHDGAHYFAPGEWGAEDQREHIYGAAGHRDREHRQPHLHVELELQRWR